MTTVLAAGTHRRTTQAGGWCRWQRVCGGLGDVLEEQCWSPGLDCCLWLKYYSLKSRSPALGLGPGRAAGVRDKRAGGRSPLILTSGNPGGGSCPLSVDVRSLLPPPTGLQGLAFLFSGRATSSPNLVEGVKFVQGTEISVAPGKHYIREEFPGRFSILRQCPNPEGPEPRIDARGHPQTASQTGCLCRSGPVRVPTGELPILGR